MNYEPGLVAALTQWTGKARANNNWWMDHCSDPNYQDILNGLAVSAVCKMQLAAGVSQGFQSESTAHYKCFSISDEAGRSSRDAAQKTWESQRWARRFWFWWWWLKQLKHVSRIILSFYHCITYVLLCNVMLRFTLHHTKGQLGTVVALDFGTLEQLALKNHLQGGGLSVMVSNTNS